MNGDLFCYERNCRERDLSVHIVVYINTSYCCCLFFVRLVFLPKMAVKGVCLTADCYSVCLSHALTTEKEEIMGLLIGEA